MNVPTNEPQTEAVEIEDISKTRGRVCEECNEKIALYQCPGCSIRTCSLHCCQAHKKRTKCTGKRQRGAYLPLCRMNDSTLRSDYFFMEEVLDAMPRAKKVSKLAEEGKSVNNSILSNTSKNNKSMVSINKKAKRLVQQAQRRGITLQIMPPVLERHRNNSSWYCSSKDLITWKVEIFLEPKVKTFSFNLSEQEEGILGQISKHVIKMFADDPSIPSEISPDKYQLLIKRLPSSANKPRYIRINSNDSLRTVLDGLTIIEYPALYCVPHENLKDFPVGASGITETATQLSGSEATSAPPAPKDSSEPDASLP